MFNLIRRVWSRSTPSQRQSHAAVPRLECLEDRTTPSSFVDSFEGPALDPYWRAFTHSGYVTFPSSVNAHSGSQSVQFNSTDSDQNKGVGLVHTFPALTYGTISVWVYDTAADVESSNYLELTVYKTSGRAVRILTQDYDFGGTQGGQYIVDGNAYVEDGLNSGIDRTQGWHKFAITCRPDGVDFRIDGILVHTDPRGLAIDGLNIDMFGPNWRPAWVSYFDDFEFVESSKPDLVASSLTVSPVATAGRDITVSLSVSNAGQDKAKAPIEVGFYLSRDVTLDPSDTRVGTIPIKVDLASGQTIPLSTKITIPSSTAGGIYQLIANVDDGNVIDEGNKEGNNTTVSGPLTVRRLSGTEWVNAFPGSRSLDTLDPAFGNNVRRFINAVHAGGAKVDIFSTFRPPERAYLMHWSWRIVNENYPANQVPSMDGVYIEWWHGDQSSSRAAAREMVYGFGIQGLGVAPALKSNHTRGLAIDMTITWNRILTVIDGKGRTHTIRGGPRDSTNSDLINIAATFDVVHFINVFRDRNHWSVNGR